MNRSLHDRLYAGLLFCLLFILWRCIWLTSGQEDDELVLANANLEAYNLNECGRQPLHHRIAHGSSGSEGQFPSFVSILIKTEGFFSETYTCGGTIIGSKHIISAAHCFKKHDISQILVTTHLFGVRYALSYEPETVYVADRICISGNFRDGQSNVRGMLTNATVYDIAVLMLQRPITFSEQVQPACLPTKPTLKQSGVVVGMGMTDMYSRATVLQYTRAVTTSCSQRTTHPSILCTKRKSPNHGRACKGDSGGPFYVSEDEQITAVGAVSFGSVICNADDAPVMFADFYNLRDEIRRVITVCILDQ